MSEIPRMRDVDGGVTPPKEPKPLTWRPIETAPRDGTPIHIMRVDWPCAPAAEWDAEGHVVNEHGDPVGGWLMDDTVRIPGQHEDGFLGWDEDPMPTHWAPVLEPPESEE